MAALRIAPTFMPPQAQCSSHIRVGTPTQARDLALGLHNDGFSPTRKFAGGILLGAATREDLWRMQAGLRATNPRQAQLLGVLAANPPLMRKLNEGHEQSAFLLSSASVVALMKRMVDKDLPTKGTVDAENIRQVLQPEGLFTPEFLRQLAKHVPAWTRERDRLVDGVVSAAAMVREVLTPSALKSSAIGRAARTPDRADGASGPKERPSTQHAQQVSEALMKLAGYLEGKIREAAT